MSSKNSKNNNPNLDHVKTQELNSLYSPEEIELRKENEGYRNGRLWQKSCVWLKIISKWLFFIFVVYVLYDYYHNLSAEKRELFVDKVWFGVAMTIIGHFIIKKFNW